GGGFCRPHVFGCIEGGDGDADVLGKADLRPGRSVRADRLNGEPVAEDGVMTHLLELGVRHGHTGCGAEVNGLAAADLHVDALSRLLDHSQTGPAIRLRQDLRPWSGSSTTSTTVQIAVAISPYPMAISNASDESTTDTGTIV